MRRTRVVVRYIAASVATALPSQSRHTITSKYGSGYRHLHSFQTDAGEEWEDSFDFPAAVILGGLRIRRIGPV